MIQIRYALKWRDVSRIGDAFMVQLRDEKRGEMVGLVLGPAAMARRLREGTARVVPDPEPPRPPAIACSDPSVAGMLDRMDIRRTLTAA